MIKLKDNVKLEDLVFPCDDLDYKICMMAPTGRAAKRMNEISNFKAKTIVLCCP